MSKTAPLLALAGLLVPAAPASAQSFRSYDAPSLNETGYGATIAIGEDEIFVAEPLNISREGAVFVYRQDQSGRWTEVAQLRAYQTEGADRFGRALAARGDYLLVGATSADESRGAAYIFQRNDAGQWVEVQKLTAQDAEEGDALGRSAALAGEFAFVGAAGHNGAAGAVYVFRRETESGVWVQHAKLTGSDAGENALFGMSLAADANHVAIGAIGLNSQTGAVYVFRFRSGTWEQEAKLEVPELSQRAQFGMAVDLIADRLLIGAPRAARNVGAVYPFLYSDGVWTAQDPLAPSDTTFQRFGSAISVSADAAWIGAPLAQRLGAVHRYAWRMGAWQAERSLEVEGVARGDQFGGALAQRGNVAVVGLSGDDYGDGTAVVLQRDGEAWRVVDRIFSEAALPDAVVNGRVDCTDGEANGSLCSQVDIVSFLPLTAIGAQRGVRLNDVWGWTDPETGAEYALVGRMDATVFLDLSDPENPVYLGELPKTDGSPGTTWRDIKVYANHAFIVSDGAGEHGMQVFDLTQLRNVASPPVTFAETAHYDGIHSAHNIVINEETGFAYAVGSSGGGQTCGGGLHMIDIRNPTNPTFAGCFAHEGTGRRGTGYSHDAQCVVYRGPDEEHVGREICVGANETALSIADVSDKTHPVALSQVSYPNVGYTHQGWLSEDQRYFFSNDELDELNGLAETTRTLIWDVTDLDDPVLVKEYFHETGSTDHNLYVNGRYLYEANNTSGLRILDVSDPANPVPVGFFDPIPMGGNAAGFDGMWSNYPFFESGLIVVTSRREGVFILRRREVVPIP